MKRPTVLVLSQIWPSVFQTLCKEFSVLQYDPSTDKHIFLKENGADARAVIINGNDTLGAAELQYLPQLEIVACSTAGFEMLDVEALKQRNIAFTNASQALTDEVADTAVMLLLATGKELILADSYVRNGDWGRKGAYPLLSSLKGKRVGIFGLGMIGLEIAARLRPMKTEIGYCTRRPKPVDYHYFQNVNSLAEWSDILVVAIPGGAETTAIIDQNVLNRLGPQGRLINIARGSVVDETALIDCLTSGTLGAAGLDVFLNEPDPDPALTSLANVVVYPHHASGTAETRCAMSQLAMDNLVAHFSDASLLSPIITRGVAL
ncbi:MAG: 2-hydroxyacid dehydrogenase [Pseudoruegeria sp.]